MCAGARTDSLRHLWTPKSTAEAMHSASPQVGSPALLVSMPTPMSATTAGGSATGVSAGRAATDTGSGLVSELPIRPAYQTCLSKRPHR